MVSHHLHTSQAVSRPTSYRARWRASWHGLRAVKHSESRFADSHNSQGAIQTALNPANDAPLRSNIEKSIMERLATRKGENQDRVGQSSRQSTRQ